MAHCKTTIRDCWHHSSTGTILALLFLISLLVPQTFAEEAGSAERRLAASARYLSSDELGGRGLGTPGLKQAAEFIADRFQQAGLATNVHQGGPFQPFQVTIGAELGGNNDFKFRGTFNGGAKPQVIRLEPGADFTPLAIGGDGTFELPLSFAGYGITAPESGYDDYAKLDVHGKAVIVLRHEPQQNNPHSVFNGTEHSEHAPFRRKISNAYQHGAEAVIFCTDEHEIRTRVAQWEKRYDVAVDQLAALHAKFANRSELSESQLAEFRQQSSKLARKIVEYADRLAAERDPVLEFTSAGTGSEAREIAVLHCRRGAVDKLLKAAGKPSLTKIEARIDRSLKPQSFELPGWSAAGTVEIDRTLVDVRNVIGVLEGSGPTADETIIVGAHFDHLGRGGQGSAAPGSTEIHNGADDNSSGVAALLEVARKLAAEPEPLARRVVFIAFTGEERGLLGSAEYARDPLFPLEDTVAMLNFDMVGRLKDNALIVHGTATGEGFDTLIDELNQRHGFEISKSEGGFGPSDHSTFYAQQIPVLHFFTGAHEDYHRPSDDFHLLNLAGIRRVNDFAAEMVQRIANAPQRPAYVEVAQKPLGDGRTNPRPYFGSIPDFSQTGGGYAISGTGAGSPAATAGFQAGDVIVKFGDFKIGNLEDFDSALRKYEAGDRVAVRVRRGQQELQLQVILDPPR